MRDAFKNVQETSINEAAETPVPKSEIYSRLRLERRGGASLLSCLTRLLKFSPVPYKVFPRVHPGALVRTNEDVSLRIVKMQFSIHVVV